MAFLVKKLVALVLLASVIVFMGCVQSPPAPTATPTPVATVQATATPTPTPTPTPVPVTPLRLDYEFSQSQGPQGQGGGQAPQQRKMYITLWLNDEKDCGGKAALVGLVKASEDATQPDDRSSWAKVTAFRENGEMAFSSNMQKSDLAFDSAKPAVPDFDFFLTLNGLFAQAGRNFNTDEVWNASIPVILRNVRFGDGTLNISVVKGEDSNAYAVPCTKFSLLAQGAGPGEMSACVAKTGAKMPLPFVASFAVGSDMQVTLKKVSSEKAAAAYFPQCMAVVKCKTVARPTDAQEQGCRAREGSFDAVRDENNCVASYQCMTQRDRAIDNIQRSQAPDCPAPGSSLVDKAIACSSKPNWNFQQGSDGCIRDISCS
ncbi:MAG: hypothetical protein NTY90_03905 [Candidatus Micrarchaeota archaeon]|nr:hypothetical protein [Candidatus Micrarchaeota archaeon]